MLLLHWQVDMGVNSVLASEWFLGRHLQILMLLTQESVIFSITFLYIHFLSFRKLAVFLFPKVNLVQPDLILLIKRPPRDNMDRRYKWPGQFLFFSGEDTETELVTAPLSSPRDVKTVSGQTGIHGFKPKKNFNTAGIINLSWKFYEITLTYT